MNLVGFGLTVHDSSVAAYKDGKFLYRKAERQFNSKHAHGNMQWAQSVLKDWDIDEYEACHSIWFDEIESFIKEKNGETFIDHHYSHLLSASKKRDDSVVLDGYAEALGIPMFGLLDSATNDLSAASYGALEDTHKLRVNEISPAILLNICSRSKYFDHESHIKNFTYVHGWFDDLAKAEDKMAHKDWDPLLSFIDIPGKIMGLKAQGTPDMVKVYEWAARTQYRTKSIMGELFNTPKDELDENLIATVHAFGEEYVKQFCLFHEFNYSGGLAQNVVWNRALLDAGKKPHIDPWAYDGGCSIGALNYLLDKHDIERPFNWEQDDEAPLGEPDGPLLTRVAELIADNKVVGWYQGHGEVGPRALGQRSLLHNPADKDGHFKVNKIKQREWWRPFGASVKEDHAHLFFDLPVSRHMLFNANVQCPDIPAVTHVDGTCRHQTVPEDHYQYYWLLEEVERKTEIPMVLNTSLNIKGKPICSKIEDAMKLFKTTEMDAICIGSELYIK